MHMIDPKKIAEVIHLVMRTSWNSGHTLRQKHMEIAARCGAAPPNLLFFFRFAAEVLQKSGNEEFAEEMARAHNALADDLEARFATEEWRSRDKYWGEQ